MTLLPPDEQKLAELFWLGVVSVTDPFEGVSAQEREWVTGDMVRRLKERVPKFDPTIKKVRSDVVQQVYAGFAITVFELERDLYAAHHAKGT
jgi:hypothetical protein